MGFFKGIPDRLINHFTNWTSGPFGKVVYFAIRQIVLYFVVILLVFLFFDTEEHRLSLVELVLIAKLLSFASIIWANGEYALANVNAGDRLVRGGNAAIIFFIVFVLTPLVFVKLGVFNIAKNDEYGILEFCIKNSYWLTSSSIFAYMILDAYIAFFRITSREKKATARKYFIFADIVTVTPFTLITLGMYFSIQHDVFQKSSLELFLSGALAITILSYALATKAVHAYN